MLTANEENRRTSDLILSGPDPYTEKNRISDSYSFDTDPDPAF
jgi:hypothetical protein